MKRQACIHMCGGVGVPCVRDEGVCGESSSAFFSNKASKGRQEEWRARGRRAKEQGTRPGVGLIKGIERESK